MCPHMCFKIRFLWEISPHDASSDVFQEGYSVKKAIHIGYNNNISPQCVFLDDLYDYHFVGMPCHNGCIDKFYPKNVPYIFHDCH